MDASDIENNLNTWLEDAHTKFADDLGFDYTGREWPMEVYAYPIPNTPNGGIVGGCWVPHLLGANYGWIEFNTDYISDEQIGKTVCGHEFFHFIQYLYEPP